MIKSISGALKKAAFTLVLLLLTTWANAPLLDIPALGSTPNSWQQAHTILTHRSARIGEIAKRALLNHKEAIKAYAIACGAALEIAEHDLSIATAKRSYSRLRKAFDPAKADEDSVKKRVFENIRQTLRGAYEYLCSYLEYEQIIQNQRSGIPARAPQINGDLPTFQSAADLIAAAYGIKQAPVSRALRAPTRQRTRAWHIAKTAPVRTSSAARPLPRLSQPSRRNTPAQRGSSSKSYSHDSNGCWWVTIRNHKFLLVNEAGQFKFPALCNGKAATFGDHRQKTIQPFPLSEKERSLVFRVLLKAGITKTTIEKTLKHSEKFKEEIKRSARKASTRSSASECGICFTSKPRRIPACTSCRQPMCTTCVESWIAQEVANDRPPSCPFCRKLDIKI